MELERMSVELLKSHKSCQEGNGNGSVDAALGAGVGAAVILAAAACFVLLATNVAQSTSGVVGCSIVAGFGGFLSLFPIGACWSDACRAYRHYKEADRFDAEIQRRAEEQTSA